MLAHAINAEWIKIRTTKAVYWTSALIVVFSVAFGAFMGWANATSYQMFVDDGDLETAAINAGALDVAGALMGLQVFGVMIILIQSALLVTGEYGNNTAKSSVLAVPKRWQLPVAKFIVYGVIAAIVTLISAVLSVLVTKWVAGLQIDDEAVLSNISLSADDAWTVMLRMVIYSLGAVALAIGIGYLLRKTAGAMAVLLLWVLVLEEIPGMFPRVKEWVPQYMPFKNIGGAVNLNDVANAPWGQAGSVIYFAVICLVIFIIGTVTLRRRDA
ncbi:ABC-type transporter, permease subunit [Corynebacterium glyciniphilum AJ 3170]|uniref:ABC-type transporter, permease subunit n=1 Tax=Corynebacterium glyciniphilum AJ 3170 TaxID=1404245 RepID=X5EF16_9CORY|nr:ABC transporter permease [Corynebacterium glyciniphilum]AHW65196.1 ABC-type transporter, permease subunit [Corynebacterium glyciniphilum AJ 3170]